MNRFFRAWALRFFPELERIDRSEYLADIRAGLRRILPWGGFIALVAWLPFLYVDRLLYPGLADELLVLRLCLTGCGLLMLIAARVPALAVRSFAIANAGIFALLSLTPLISNLVGNDPRYVSGYLLALIVVSLFPIPFGHALIQISLSLVIYFLSANWTGAAILGRENFYSLANIAIAYGITILMLYLNERARLRAWLRKVKLEQTRTELKSRNEALEFDLDLARDVQQNLLPESFPHTHHLDIDALFLAMEQVGGDFYEIMDLSASGRPEDRNLTVVFIADVSGHGVSAAMIAGMTKLSFSHALSSGLRDPAEIFAFINRDLMQYLLDEQFLTAFLGLLDTESGDFRYANACHRPVVRMTAAGETDELDAEGTMIGMFDTLDTEVRQTRLAPGSILLFYTDGIVETRDVERREFGPELLATELKRHRGGTATEILRGLKSALDEFSRGAEREDDLTMLVLRYLG